MMTIQLLLNTSSDYKLAASRSGLFICRVNLVITFFFFFGVLIFFSLMASLSPYRNISLTHRTVLKMFEKSYYVCNEPSLP